MANDNGGPAFPRPAFYPDDPADHMEPRERQGWSHGDQTGMTLRDWFAGQALAGQLAKGYGLNVDALAADSYLIADAMLKCRTK